MTNQFQPLRPAAGAPLPVPATPGGLIRSTLLAAGAAVTILVLFWLPAEYGIDPTGVGRLTGLTEMGEIKQQLAAEAEADAQAAAAVPALVAPELIARLDRIEAQLALLTSAVQTPATAPVPTTEAPAAAPEAAPAEWRDEVSYTLAPGEGIEVKLAMQEGQTARFAWTANGGVVNFDQHGDGSGQKVSYEQGRAVPEMSGELTAAFTGNHGWFWRNRTEAPVTVTLRTGGEYQELRAP
ncbi:MAG: hypothetical protein ACKO1H_06495 [Tabrizicola sp.]